MMVEVVLLAALALFALPVLAGSSGRLVGLGLLALVPALIFLALAHAAGDSVERGYMMAFAVVAAAPAIGGIAARSVSLAARARGRNRPGTLWIEGLAGLVSVVFVLVLIGII